MKRLHECAGTIACAAALLAHPAVAQQPEGASPEGRTASLERGTSSLEGSTWVVRLEESTSGAGPASAAFEGWVTFAASNPPGALRATATLTPRSDAGTTLGLEAVVPSADTAAVRFTLVSHARRAPGANGLPTRVDDAPRVLRIRSGVSLRAAIEGREAELRVRPGEPPLRLDVTLAATGTELRGTWRGDGRGGPAVLRPVGAPGTGISSDPPATEIVFPRCRP